MWISDETGATVMQRFGRGPEAFAACLAILSRFALDRADEARRLMDRPRLG